MSDAAGDQLRKKEPNGVLFATSGTTSTMPRRIRIHRPGDLEQTDARSTVYLLGWHRRTLAGVSRYLKRKAPGIVNASPIRRLCDV